MLLRDSPHYISLTTPRSCTQLATAHDLGERTIIELIVETLDKMPDMPIPFGDDVTAVPMGRDRLAVLKADMLVGKTDIPPGMSMFQAARKAVVMNISDFASKGVKPLAALVSLGLPREVSKENILDIGLGLNAGATEYGAYVIGGDTSEASDIIISCMLFGASPKRTIMTRSGARPGDILAVTGPFGKTAAGLKVLLEGLHAPSNIRERLMEAVYMPKARLKEGLALSKTGAVTASIDSSDGLAVSLHELRRMSRTGFTVTNVPTAPEAEEFAKAHRLDPKALTLFGGEEYELVLAIDPKSWKRAANAVGSVGGTLIQIGSVAENREIVLKTREGVEPIPPGGWEHFKR